LHRTQSTTLAFAIVAALVTVISAAVAYRGLRAAFEREFEARLAKVAAIAASQVGAEDAQDIRRLGAESGGYYALQAQLDMLCAVTGYDNLALVDSSGATLYDVRRGEAGLLERSEYDSLAHGAMRRALAGVPVALRLGTGQAATHAAFAPARLDGRVLGVMVAEGSPSWEPELLRLRRRVTLVALVSVLAIAILAGILMRSTARGLALERRLTRSENLAAMGRLTATLAHEIRNPLAIIRGSARRLGKLEPEARTLADSLIEEVDRLNRTLTRYLTFARGGSPDDETGDAGEALVSTLDLLEGEFRERGCVLERDGVPASAIVRLDPESLKQVCLNLVLNALEASPEGGRVRAGLAVRGTSAEMTFRDQGPGLTPEILRRLGEPFLTTKAHGTGLGLFLTRRLVEGAGGHLRAENVAGGGALVVIRLPLVGG
jgi:signal transduction histidine kinase